MQGIQTNLSTYPQEFKDNAKKVFKFQNNVKVMLQRATVFGAPDDNVALDFLRQALNFVEQNQDGNDLFQSLSKCLPIYEERNSDELWNLIRSGVQENSNSVGRSCAGDIEDLGGVSGCATCQNKCTAELDFDLAEVSQTLNG